MILTDALNIPRQFVAALNDVLDLVDRINPAALKGGASSDELGQLRSKVAGLESMAREAIETPRAAAITFTLPGGIEVSVAGGQTLDADGVNSLIGILQTLKMAKTTTRGDGA